MKRHGRAGSQHNEAYIDDSGTIRHKLRGEQDVVSITKLREATIPLINRLRAARKPVHIYVDLSDVHRPDSETRTEAKRFLELDFDFLAVRGNRYLQPIVSYVLRITGQSYRVRYFSKESDALAWLSNPHATRRGPAELVNRTRGVSTSSWVVLVVLVLMGALSFLSWRQSQDRVNADAQRLFETKAEQVADTLADRLQGYVDSLIGFQGLFHSSEDVNEKEFGDYFATLDLQDRYPGINNVTFVTRVSHTGKGAFIQKIRSDTSVHSSGDPTFAITPEGARPEYYVLTYIGTGATTNNKGLDLLTNATRRNVLQAARDSGEPAATETTKLLDNTGQPNGNPGFILALPIYKDSIPATIAERQRDIEGFTLAVFDYTTLLGGTLEPFADDDVYINLTDAQGARVYQQGTEPAEGGNTKDIPISIGTQEWTLRVGTPALYGLTLAERNYPRVIATFGIIVSALLLIVFWVQVRARRRAVRLADMMTEDLQHERNSAEATKNKDEAILSSIGDGVFALDNEGRVILFNRVAERMSGFAAAEVLGTMYGETFSFRSAHNHETHNFISRAQAGEQAKMARGTVLVRKDGTMLPVADSAAPVFNAERKQQGVIVVFRDITEQEHYEKALRESNERFELAAKATSDVVYDLDIATGIMKWNDALHVAYGFSRDEEISSMEWWAHNIHPDDTVKVTQAFDKLLDAKVNNWMAEYRFKKADGTYVYVRDRAFVLRNEKGHATRVIGSMLDITQQKQLDQAKDEFISIVSHQLRTPLTAIRLFIEMLVGQQVGKLAGKQLDYAQKIEASTNRMIRLVGDILNVSRMELGRLKIEPELADVNVLIQSQIDEVEPLSAEKKVKIIFKPVGGLPKVKVDPTIFGQVVHNLLTNAIRYTPEKKGLITVQFEALEDDGYELRVSDNGIGIPVSAQPSIFQRFYRADNAVAVAGEGTGLGLYLIKLITDSTGGSVRFTSEEGKGTTFYVKLPHGGMKAKQGDKTLN